jgi:hypothetical protein
MCTRDLKHVATITCIHARATTLLYKLTLLTTTQLLIAVMRLFGVLPDADAVGHVCLAHVSQLQL